MIDFEDYEKECKQIRKQNSVLIKKFSQWMKDNNLSDRTIGKHCDNIDFYINEYLLYSDTCPASDGTYAVSMYLGDWFIRKAMWANVASIKSNATSIKKFYGFMLSIDEIDKEMFDELKDDIKQNLPKWVDTIRKYDDESVDFDNIWDY